MRRTLDCRMLRDAAVIFIAALGLGLAYDAVSPLGVRAPGPAAAPAPAPASSASGTVAVPLPEMPASAPDSTLQNVTIAALIWPDARGASQPLAGARLPVSMSWPEVQPLLATGEIFLVDGRDRLSYEAGHIPGAVSLPMSTLKEQIAGFTAKYPQTRPLVISSSTAPASAAR